jgi:lysyl-tRNA synthetase class II
MFVSNEKMIGMKVTLTEGVWTEKGYYTRGHIMKIKDLGKWGVFVLEDEDGELQIMMNRFTVVDEFLVAEEGCDD